MKTGALGDVLRTGQFRNFWLGFTLSGIGDAMTKTALVWYVYDHTRSTTAVGLLLLAYAGPVTLGGLAAGYLLDRFDRRMVMLVDSLVRGVVVLSLPIAAALGGVSLAQVYIVAAVYGFLFMIPLAGTPSLIPSLVRPDQLTAANSLETLAFTVSGVLGPAIAGVLIAGIGVPYVLAIDAVTFFFFAAVLARTKLSDEPEPAPTATGERSAYRLADAARLMLRNPVLLSTTLMFMAFNAGAGLLQVWLPVQASTLEPVNGAQLYGTLLAVTAIGETIGALGAASLTGLTTEGRLICASQFLAGLSLVLVLAGPSVWTTGAALFLLGFFSAPMTAWAQTLRMRVIPPALRGRTFALLRTLMQASAPAFSAIGGALFGLVGLRVMIGLSAGLIAVPGLIGSRVRGLVDAGGPPASPREAPEPPETAEADAAAKQLDVVD